MTGARTATNGSTGARAGGARQTCRTYGSINQSQYVDALKQVHDMLANQDIKVWAGLTNGSALDTTKLAPSFVDYVLGQLVTQFGIGHASLATAGWKIYTTLDYNLENTSRRTSTTTSTSPTRHPRRTYSAVEVLQ